jgi:hypothetical protein
LRLIHGFEFFPDGIFLLIGVLLHHFDGHVSSDGEEDKAA